jgi:hypothetical protein
MLHRSHTYFLPVRFKVSRQPALPNSSGVSGPPDTSFCGGIVSVTSLRRESLAPLRRSGPVMVVLFPRAGPRRQARPR